MIRHGIHGQEHPVARNGGTCVCEKTTSELTGDEAAMWVRKSGRQGA